MGKMSELQQTIDSLRSAAALICDAVDTLEELFGGTGPSEEESAAKKAISFNEISDQLMAIARISKAHSEKLRVVVLQYGASKLSDVSPEHYEAILAAAEEIKNAG